MLYRLVQTETYAKWETGLRDKKARAFIAARLTRLSRGLIGDVRMVGNGVSELRIHYGPGYRVYFHQQGEEIIILLCGGDKDSQTRDIRRAKQLINEEDA